MVIPAKDIDVDIRVDESRLKTLTPIGVVEGFDWVDGYQSLIGITWDEAQQYVDAEARWLERAAAAQNAGEFDEILESAPEEEAPDDFDWLFHYIDVGVAGLVHVLSAAGYATCYSCRGHARHVSEPIAPQVRLGTEAERLRKLVSYADRAGCGLDLDGAGLINVYARSVSELHALARLMLGDRAVFDALQPAPWRARAMKALEHGEDFEWDDDERE